MKCDGQWKCACARISGGDFWEERKKALFILCCWPHATDAHVQGTGGRCLHNKEPPRDYCTPPPPRASTRARHTQTSKSKRPLCLYFFAHGARRRKRNAFKKRWWREGHKHMRKEQEVAASATKNHSRTTTHHLDSVGQSTRRAQSRGDRRQSMRSYFFFGVNVTII